MRRFIGVFAFLLAALLLSGSALAQQDIISTAIGGGPNDVPAVDANLNVPLGVAVDSAGNYYISVNSAHRVFKVDGKTQTLTVLAGIGIPGYGGDGVKGGAAQAFLYNPQDVAVDGAGNVYIADYNNSVIRKVDKTNTITTIAGEAGQCNYNGDGTPATKFNLCHPVGLALDKTGANLYIGDMSNQRTRKLVLKTDSISTFAGTGNCGFSGDGGPATSAALCNPDGVAVDGAGNVFIGDSSNYVIREVTKSNGNIKTIAGTPQSAGFGGDGGPATSAKINTVVNLTVDSAGKIVTFPDNSNYRVRQFTVGGNINTVAGNGSYGFGGDGGAATSAQISNAQGIAATSTAGQFLIADNNNYRIRQFTVGGNINTVAGNGSPTVPTLITGVDPSGVVFNYPYGVFEDSSQNVFVADVQNNMVRELLHSKDLVNFFAGSGVYGYSGDGGPAQQAQLRYPAGSAEDSSGNVYIADQNNCLIRKVNPAGNISTFAGFVFNNSPQCGYNGDGGPATNAKIGAATSVFVDSKNNVYIADRTNHVVREVTGGNINTIAGIGGHLGYGGDGGLAVNAFLYNPTGVTADPAGNVFIADESNCRVREVFAATGVINTVAGNGGCGFTGDGPATQEELNAPQGVAVDANDNLFIADTNNYIIRWVSAGGLMTTIAGIPQSPGFNGDGLPATSAQLYLPSGVFEDPSGNYLIADQYNFRIRGVTAFAALSVAPASLTFPLTTVGSTSNPQIVTLSALGPLTINNIQTNSLEFSEADNCPASLPNGQACTVYVYFSPGGAGTRLGTLTVNDNGFFNPVSTVSLTGVGSAITLSGVPINFGVQLVKTTSGVKNVTITNTGTSAITMGTITLNETTDFAIKTNNCPAKGQPLAGGASCKLGMTFTPKSTGAKKGAVIINDSDPTSPQIAGLSGTGTSNVILSPSSFNFGFEPVGLASAATTITLINNTGNTLTLGKPAVSTSGDFVINKSKTTCTDNLQVAASGTCAIVVAFKPTKIGYRVGTVIVSDNDPTSPQTAALTGIGISIGFTPASVNFGTIPKGQQRCDTETITNSGPAPVTFTGSDIVGPNSPDFSESNSTCPATLAAGASCNVNVCFLPTLTKKESATFNLFDNSLGSPQKLPMVGTGQ